MRSIIISCVVSLLTSCNPPIELKTSPFDPNMGRTVQDLKDWGFNVQSLDDGICVYSKNISDSIEMYFYLDFEDDCNMTTGQGVVINLDTINFHVTREQILRDNDDKWFDMNKGEFKKDSLKILGLLKAFGGTKASNAKRLGVSTQLMFEVKQNDSGRIVPCTYSGYPQNQKTLTFEQTWQNPRK
jgi:hypothetical protein